MRILTFEQFVTEKGESAGKLEIVKTSVDLARAYAEGQFQSNGRDLDEELPNFDKNYQEAQKRAGTGKTKRRDMPVIDTDDVKLFQQRLKQGHLDVDTPNADLDFLKSDPFPEGLSGDQAKKFVEAGMEKHDGDQDDDKVKVSMKKVAFKDLKPIQRQIYFDKSINATAQFGAKGTTDFLTKHSILIASSDNYIIDGHHRFLSGLLVDGNLKSDVLVIDLPISVLLPLSRSYGDAIGNQRNL